MLTERPLELVGAFSEIRPVIWCQECSDYGSYESACSRQERNYDEILNDIYVHLQLK